MVLTAAAAVALAVHETVVCAAWHRAVAASGRADAAVDAAPAADVAVAAAVVR